MTTFNSHSQSTRSRPLGTRIASPSAITAEIGLGNRYGFCRVSSGLRSQIPGDGFGRILRPRLATGTSLHFSVVLTIVHRRIKNGHGIHHGRQNLDRLQIVYVSGPLSRSVASRSNSIEASPDFFVSRNKLLHISWCSHFRGAGRTLKRGTGTRDVYGDTIAQYQSDEGLIAALKST